MSEVAVIGAQKNEAVFNGLAKQSQMLANEFLEMSKKYDARFLFSSLTGFMGAMSRDMVRAEVITMQEAKGIFGIALMSLADAHTPVVANDA